MPPTTKGSQGGVATGGLQDCRTCRPQVHMPCRATGSQALQCRRSAGRPASCPTCRLAPCRPKADLVPLVPDLQVPDPGAARDLQVPDPGAARGLQVPDP